jgi:hypothetical protein
MFSGVSHDETAEAADDDHEDDLWFVLAQACTEDDYEFITKISFEYCDLWQQFWDKQCRSPIRTLQKIRFNASIPVLLF